MSIEAVKYNISKIKDYKSDEDIINQLIEFKEVIKNIEEISKTVNVTLKQLLKASSKKEKKPFDTEMIFKEIENYEENKKEEDIISAIINLTDIFCHIESGIKETGFETKMVLKSLGMKNQDEAKEEKKPENKKTTSKEQKQEVKEKVSTKEDNTKNQVEEKVEEKPENKKATSKEPKQEAKEDIESEDIIF